MRFLDKLRIFKRIVDLENDLGYSRRNARAMRLSTYQCLVDDAIILDKITTLLEAKYGEDWADGIKTWRDKKAE